jgi:Ser/Thr protein kinase RdoA (MazF antagonist)
MTPHRTTDARPRLPYDRAVSEVEHTRRQLALQAAREVAQHVGLNDVGARVLHDAHNTLILLPEARVVVKVATSALDERGEDALRQGLAIGLHLAARGAPIVPPLLDGDSGPHEINGQLLTLWSYSAPYPAPDQPGLDLGIALRALHEALADFASPLPPFTEKLEGAAALFADPTKTPELVASDRQLATSIYDNLLPQLEMVAPRAMLHGEPHSNNVLWTRNGPRFIDFEAACAGPAEWDLAFLPEQAYEAFPGHDEELLALLRTAISFCVAAWCWAQRGRAPEVDEAAMFHLNALRRTARATN